MLGNNLFRVESKVDISIEKYRSLIFFYEPLIGNDALYLYQFLSLKGESVAFEEINKLLNSLLISIEKLEEELSILNEYKLLKTYKAKDSDNYIFELIDPLSIKDFIQDDILVRDFILKTSGKYYQSLISNIRVSNNHKDYDDISKKINPKVLDNWTESDESFLKVSQKVNNYDFGTFFDVNVFLDNVSTNLLPMRFRTPSNLKEIAVLADLYNISYEKMKRFIPKIAKTDSDALDLNLLRYQCQNTQQEYTTISNGEYDVPCALFLMNKQNGKEVTNYDAKILYTLNHDYHLNPSVINVLIEYALNNCDNRLVEKYLYAIASDLNRNNVKDAKEALTRLGKYVDKVENRNNYKLNYDNSKNIEYDLDRFNEIINSRGKHE